MNTYSFSCFVNLKIIVRTFANMVGPLGPPKNYAAFRPHKGRTKFLCDYNTVNEQSLLHYDDGNYPILERNVCELDIVTMFLFWTIVGEHYLDDDAYRVTIRMTMRAI